MLYFIYGTIFGSFLTLCAERLPLRKTIFYGRSACQHCGQKLCWIDLIPLVSQCLGHSRCRYCQARYSWSCFVGEALSGLIFLAGGLAWLTIPECVLLLLALFFSLTDYYYGELENRVFWFSCLGFWLWQPAIQLWQGLFVLVGLLIFVKRHWLGLGDVLLVTFWAFYLPLPLFLWLLLLASFSALLWLLWQQKKGRIPFVPFLASGLAVVLLLF